MSTTVWRVHLKPDKSKDITYRDLLEYCKNKGCIGVGWSAVQERNTDPVAIRNECNVYAKPKAAYKAIHAMSLLKEGDLVWTRLGEDASEYYLCRVGKELWKDYRIPREDQEKYDISNVVSAQWIKVGKQNKVPGKVINAFSPSATIQRVYEVEMVSSIIWNEMSPNDYPKYETKDLTMKDFWSMIDSEELENLVLLYVQSLGYYVYTSTAKISNPKYEAVLISNDGSHYAYPQVKRNEYLDPKYYAEGISEHDKVFLFSSSEDYGKPIPNVRCITKSEIESFMNRQSRILTEPLREMIGKIKK